MTAGDREWLARKLKIYDMLPAGGVDHFRKIVAGKQLWNYDNLEPSEAGALEERVMPKKPTATTIAKKRNGQPSPAARWRGRRRKAKSIFSASHASSRPRSSTTSISSRSSAATACAASRCSKIPHWDDLTFLPGTLTRFVIEGYREKCETKTVIGPRAKRPMELDIPIYVTGMSFGALSYEAKIALARGATMAGSATCSGEGMIPDERRYSMKWLYQCIQSRYGFNPHHLRLADACEFFIGQGCKVGLGGHLMGQKVTDQVAEMRSLPAGIDQRSPARHPDWLGPDDLALKINEIREATNAEIPIQLKLGAARVYDDVRMAVKCDPDSIY